MKFKHFATLVALTLTCGAQAQEDQAALQSRLDSLENVINTREADNTFNTRQDNMWRRKKAFTIGWVNQTLEMIPQAENEPGAEWKSKLGVALSPWAKTWYLHKAIAGMVRFGIDGGIDINFAQYKKGSGIHLDGVGDDLIPDLGGDAGDYDPDYNDAINDALDLGMYQAEAGLGVGPSVTVAPFYPFGNKYLDDLKVRLYYHLVPSGSLIIRSGDGDNEINSAFCMFQRFGAAISWKAISLGIEHRWGKAKYGAFNLDDEEGGSDAKPKFKTTSTRFYIAFRMGR